MKKAFYNVDDAGKTFLWCILAPQILGFLAQIILISISTFYGTTVQEVLQNTAVYVSYAMLAQLAFGLVFLYVSKKTNIKSALKLNFNLGLINIVFCVLIGVIGVIGLSPISSIGTEILKFIGYAVDESFVFDINSVSFLIVSIILLAGVPAIIEEFVFRGVIFQGLRKYGNWVAILGSSALFALVHLSAEQFIFPFLFGIIMAYIVLKTGSIFASMIIHFVANTLTVLLNYFKVEIMFDIDFVWFVLIALGIGLATFCIVWLMSKKMKNVEKTKEVEEVLAVIDNAEFANKNKGNTSNLKFGIIFGIVIWVINFAYYMIL
ncbi:MAG: CPBP family intramembrane metalloprotease [Clostridia bacterium]|nr:CPBP family intramembrane metalloprotease [Clostridia bacterium]